LVESATPGQLGVLHERDWDADAAPEWLATFGQQRVTQTAGINQKLIADDFVAVDVNKTYGLSGWARSGDNFGMRFNPLNQQSFGLEEYDADYLRIESKHVLKYGSAADTTSQAGALHPTQRLERWHGTATATKLERNTPTIRTLAMWQLAMLQVCGAPAESIFQLARFP
jgi:hypothetical protein